MNKPVNLAVLVASALMAVSTVASAQTADPKNSGYVISPNSEVVKSGSGLCWRTGFWAPANAIKGCDDDLLPKTAAPAPGCCTPFADGSPAGRRRPGCRTRTACAGSGSPGCRCSGCARRARR
jgi:hypothetical protein